LEEVLFLVDELFADDGLLSEGEAFLVVGFFAAEDLFSRDELFNAEGFGSANTLRVKRFCGRRLRQLSFPWIAYCRIPTTLLVTK
jgi:hypothetical protein